MLSDDDLWDANAAGMTAYTKAHSGLRYTSEGEAMAGLRAVEAAVRADQIDYRERLAAAGIEQMKLVEQLAAVQAVIAEAYTVAMMQSGKAAARILSQSPTDALQAHDRQVAAKAWDEGLDAGRDRWMDHREFGDPPVNPYAVIASEPSERGSDE